MNVRFYLSTSILVLLALLLTGVSSIRAQSVGATLSGTVTDASKAVVPGAKISITNAATSLTRVVTTDGQGFYTVTNVPAGVYRVAISAQGFSTRVENNVQLSVGGARELNASLSLGDGAGQGRRER